MSIITQLVLEHALRIRVREDAPATPGGKAADPTASRKSANLVGRINNLITTDLENLGRYIIRFVTPTHSFRSQWP